MRIKRLLVVTTIALAIGCLVLGVSVMRLRNQLGRAEHYAQSGVDSVSMICTAVVLALRAPGDKFELAQVARACVGARLDRDPAVAAGEFSRRDWPAIANRIEAQIKARHLPYPAFESVKDHLLPEGYLEGR